MLGLVRWVIYVYSYTHQPKARCWVLVLNETWLHSNLLDLMIQLDEPTSFCAESPELLCKTRVSWICKKCSPHKIKTMRGKKNKKNKQNSTCVSFGAITASTGTSCDGWCYAEPFKAPCACAYLTLTGCNKSCLSNLLIALITLLQEKCVFKIKSSFLLLICHLIFALNRQ